MRYLLIVVLLIGCASASKFNDLSVGMTKQEVIDKLGKPDSTSANEKGEFLRYTYDTDNRIVFIKNNKVVRFGTPNIVLDKEDRPVTTTPVPLLLSH